MFGYGLVIVTLLVMKLTPQSPLGRRLNLALVERPLERVAAMNRRHILWLVLVMGLTLFGTEMIMMFGSYDLLTLYAWDLTVYLDTMMVAYALVAVARGRSALRWLALRGSLIVRRTASRARRTRAVAGKPEGGANDDDPAPAWSLAA